MPQEGQGLDFRQEEGEVVLVSAPESPGAGLPQYSQRYSSSLVLYSQSAAGSPCSKFKAGCSLSLCFILCILSQEV